MKKNTSVTFYDCSQCCSDIGQGFKTKCKPHGFNPLSSGSLNSTFNWGSVFISLSFSEEVHTASASASPHTVVHWGLDLNILQCYNLEICSSLWLFVMTISWQKIAHDVELGKKNHYILQYFLLIPACCCNQLPNHVISWMEFMQVQCLVKVFNPLKVIRFVWIIHSSYTDCSRQHFFYCKPTWS